MRASSPEGFSIEVSFEGLEDLRQSFRHVPTVRRAAPKAPTRRNPKWPIVLCGLFAMTAAGAAVSASPLGQHPSVRPRIDAARAAVTAAWHHVAIRVHM